jgi:hypothetical protein
MSNEKPVNVKSVKSFSAVINIGLRYGYSEKEIEPDEIFKAIQEFQNELIEENEVYLSVSATPCHIILSGQKEPHLKLGFINYPKFPLDEKVLKAHIGELALRLMKQFSQKQMVIEYPDQTLMLETTRENDPRIKTDGQNT